jgi:lipoprotein NlpI
VRWVRAQSGATCGAKLTGQQTDADAIVHRGRLLERVGNAAGAGADLEAACALQPGCAEFAASLGLHHRAAGRWDAALAALDRALQLDPTSGPVHAHRGCVRTPRAAVPTWTNVDDGAPPPVAGPA